MQFSNWNMIFFSILSLAAPVSSLDLAQQKPNLYKLRYVPLPSFSNLNVFGTLEAVLKIMKVSSTDVSSPTFLCFLFHLIHLVGGHNIILLCFLSLLDILVAKEKIIGQLLTFSFVSSFYVDLTLYTGLHLYHGIFMIISGCSFFM